MDEKQLAEIKERCEKATPGPWKVVEGKSFGVQSENKNIASCFRTENEQFIAHSRTDIPELIAEVERLKAENRKIVYCGQCASCTCGETPYDMYCEELDRNCYTIGFCGFGQPKERENNGR